MRANAMLSLGHKRRLQARRVRLYQLVPMLLVLLLLVVVVSGCGGKGGGY